MSTTMLYKFPGPHEIHGARFDYVIVGDEQIEQTIADGWYLTTTEAKAAAEAPPEPVAPTGDEAPPTRAELEQKAAELGIEFSPRIGDAKLSERIDAALAGKN